MRNAPPPPASEVFYSVRDDKTVPLKTLEQQPPDFSRWDAAACAARKLEIQRRLGATRGDPSKTAEREALKHEELFLDGRIRDLKDATKRENMRRTFAGLMSPLHEVLVERLAPELVAELEAAAFARLAERERRTAERKATKGTAEAATTPGGGKPRP